MKLPLLEACVVIGITAGGYGVRYAFEPVRPPGDIRKVIAACAKAGYECTVSVLSNGVILHVYVTSKYRGDDFSAATIEDAAKDASAQFGKLAAALK